MAVPLDRAVDDTTGQPIAVDDRVMSRAQQRGVGGDVGGSAVCPVQEMVGVAPCGGDVAAVEGAVSVSFPQGADLAEGEEPDGATLVEDFTAAAEDRGDDRGIAGELAHGRGRQRRAIRAGTDGDAGAQLVTQRVKVHGHHQDGFGAERASTAMSASPRRRGTGRISRSPVAPSGQGADSGPIAASRTDLPSPSTVNR